MSEAVVGGVDYSFNKYRINPVAQPAFTAGADPSANAAPAAFARDGAYSVANFNVENLYDYRDDPFDGCDFVGNTGCPGVSPPFDYVPTSAADYDEHLGALAEQVADDLHAPDVLLVQEAEDQDICTVSGTALACGTTDDRDGKPDTLQELALRIAAVGGPRYDAAYDRDGADDRGIVAAFLYRADRVELLPAAGPVLGAAPDRGVSRRRARVQHRRPEPEGAQRRPPVGRGHLDRRGRLQRLHPRAAGGPLPRLAERHRRERRRPRRRGSTSTRSRTTSRRRPTRAWGSGGSRPPTWPRS